VRVRQEDARCAAQAEPRQPNAPPLAPLGAPGPERPSAGRLDPIALMTSLTSAYSRHSAHWGNRYRWVEPARVPDAPEQDRGWQAVHEPLRFGVVRVTGLRARH
jgi:hypothetical protein